MSLKEQIRDDPLLLLAPLLAFSPALALVLLAWVLRVGG